MKKIIYSIVGFFTLTSAFTACTDAVEKTDLGTISEEVIWNSPAFIKGYFDNTMAGAVPGAGTMSVHADEQYDALDLDVVYDNYTTGKINSVDRWTYTGLRNINRFLDHAGYDGFQSHLPMTDKLDAKEKEDMVAQMLVIRAYHYFDMVRSYGGVPVLLHEQEASANYEELYTARSKTSECIIQIIKDLDAAIAIPDASFPMKRTDGHIGKGVAYALKGRVLLYYASPQFTKQTPAGTKSVEQRWNEAYTACKEAYDKLSAAGFGLYAPDGGDRKTVMNNYYKMLVTEKLNKEMIWVRRYEAGIYNNWLDQALRPVSSWGRTASPCWEMTASFSNADGTPFTAVKVDYDKDAGGGTGTYTQGAKTPGLIPDAPDGTPVNTAVFWLDREPRFYAFIGYNGCEWPLIRDNQSVFNTDVKDGKMQHEWVFCKSEGISPPFTNGYASTNSRGQGICTRKFVSDDRNYGLSGTSTLKECSTDWPLFRFAEVVLNLAEAAAKTTGHTQEAYDMLDAVRKRAGIPAANGYGLGRKTGDALILDILNERKIELFLEGGQRYYDVRRWRLYSDGLAGFKINGLQRHNFHAWLKKPAEVTNVADMVEKLKPILAAGGIDTPEGREAYFDVFYHTFMLYDAIPIKYNPDRQDFLRIPYDAHIRKNPTIEQTIGWSDERGAGTFNPYE